MAVEGGDDGKEETWEDLFGDGSVLKQLVRAAPAEETSDTPKRGDRVTVHYKGTLSESGTQFDASRDRGKPFEFNVGSGVIAGWSEAVPTMRRGEIAKFRIAAAKAYGEKGQPPTIPANASLDFEIELLKFTDREDITGDGSVMKKVLKEGNRWQRPNKHCDVKIDARICPDGQWVSGWWPSSKRFHDMTFGSGGGSGGGGSGGDDGTASVSVTLPSKLRVAIETMKADETADVQLHGVTDTSYEVFVHSWVENEECVPSKPGAVVKRTEEKAPSSEDDWKKPNDTDVVTVKGEIRRASAPPTDPPLYTFGDTGATWRLDEHEGFAVVAGVDKDDKDGKDDDGPSASSSSSEQQQEKQVPTKKIPLCDGLEAGLKKMKVGEKALIHIRDDFGYQDHQVARLPADCDMPPVTKVPLEALVELVKVEEGKPYWEMTGDEKLAACEEKKAMGNAHFARGDYERAIRRYAKAIDTGNSMYDVPEELQPKIKASTKASKLNRAACHLKHGDYAAAKADCTDILNDEPSNLKALFRRAKALSALDDWPLAKADLRLILERDPNNVDAKRALNDVAAKEKQHKSKLKGLYAGRRLFSKKDDRPRDAALPEAEPLQFPTGEPPLDDAVEPTTTVNPPEAPDDDDDDDGAK